ncbi:CoA transferase [Streptomyces sp. NPDC055144]
MGDLGADARKRERLDPGDPLRQQPAEFEAESRGKHGLTVLLEDPQGCSVPLEVAGTADVLTVGFRSAVMDWLGLGFGKLKRVKPGLVCQPVALHLCKRALGRSEPLPVQEGWAVEQHHIMRRLARAEDTRDALTAGREKRPPHPPAADPTVHRNRSQ